MELTGIHMHSHTLIYVKIYVKVRSNPPAVVRGRLKPCCCVVDFLKTCVWMSQTFFFSFCWSCGPSVWQIVPWQCWCISSKMTCGSFSYRSPVSQAQMCTHKYIHKHTHAALKHALTHNHITAWNIRQIHRHANIPTHAHWQHNTGTRGPLV